MTAYDTMKGFFKRWFKNLYSYINMADSGFFSSLSGASSSFKSTVLRPLGAMALILLPCIITASKFSEKWVVILLSVCFSVLFLCFIGTYIYCLFTNPNLIRSERHTEQMQAMEKGYILGDTSSGIKLLNVKDIQKESTSGTSGQ